MKLKSLLSNYRIIILIFILFAILASVQSLLLGSKTFDDSGIEYTHYNNYKIFKHSFQHLIEGENLYKLYPVQHWDFFKYSPTFASFFGIFSVLPDWLGLILWNLLNALVLLFAVYYLPGITNYQKGLILILSLVELMTSLQNDQSNALIAGLLILAFGLLEKENYFWAVFCIVFSSYIKLFGLMGFALIFFYPGKMKSVLYSIFWWILLSFIPLLFVSLKQYMFLISEWWGVITLDYSGSYGYSVMGWLNSWSGIEINKFIVIGGGLLLLLIPFLRIKKYRHYGFRLLTLVSLLIWVVIFNHKAESPTFIIAMVGISTWFVISEKTTLNIILFVTAFIFTSLSPTDIFPMFIREGFFKPYIIKVVPCIIIWCKIIYDLTFTTDFKIYLHKNHNIVNNV